MRSPGRRLKLWGLFLISCGIITFLAIAISAWNLHLPQYTWLTPEGLLLPGLLVVGGGVALALGVLEDRPHKRRQRGLCLNCGYNLAGLPEPRCPECGQPFEPKGD